MVKNLKSKGKTDVHIGTASSIIANLTSGKLAGINNKIKTIKRKAYGCKDLQHLVLKIIAATAINS